MRVLTREDFIAKLVHRAASRYGVPPKNVDRVLSIWIDDEHLVAGPEPKGRRRGMNPDWQWGRDTYRAALQVWRFRGVGAKSYDIIRIEMWLRRCNIDFHEFQKSLNHQFQRFKKHNKRKTASNFDPRNKEPPGDRTKRNIASAMTAGSGKGGESASPLSIESMVALYGHIFFGAGNIEQLLDEIYSRWLIMSLIEKQLPGSREFLSKGLCGLLGNSDEISNATEKILRRDDKALFEDARQFANLLPWLTANASYLFELLSPPGAFDNAAIHEFCIDMANGLKLGYPRMHAFIALVHLMHVDPVWRNIASRLSIELIPALQEVVAFTRNNYTVHRLLGSANPIAFLTLFLPGKFQREPISPAKLAAVKELLWDHGLAALFAAMQNRP